jgi:hypothetical protein
MNTYKCTIRGRDAPIIIEDVTGVTNAIGVLRSEHQVDELDITSIDLVDEYELAKDFSD